MRNLIDLASLEEPEGTLTDTGLWIPRPKSRFEAVDLFCGAGGFSIGLEAGGIDVVGALENDAYAAITYLWNLGSPRGCAISYVTDADQAAFHKALQCAQRDRRNLCDVVPGDHGWIGFQRTLGEAEANGWRGCGFDAGCRGMVFGDATRATGEMILDALHQGGWAGSIDLVVGGPPCQGISILNAKRKLTDPRNNLVLEFVRLAAELDTPLWIMENVPPLITEKKYRPLFMAIVEAAKERGYSVVANVVDAVNYGVPQYRRRALIMGHQEGTRIPSLPMPSNWGLVFPYDGEPACTLDWDRRLGREKVEKQAPRQASLL